MITKILKKALNGDDITLDEAKTLFDTKEESEVNDIKFTANEIRNRLVGDKVSYIINLNVNFTNICEANCLFCGFRRNEKDEDSYILNLDEFEEKLYFYQKQGIKEICLQGGLYSKLKIKGLSTKNLLDTYAKLLVWIKERLPEVHLHAFSPEEIDMLSQIGSKNIKYVFEYLKDNGLDSIPGTAAEILDDDIRKIICPHKLNTQKWCEVVKTAHNLNIPSTATILYGHIENNYHRANHLDILRDIQKETSGFTEFIPLSFIPFKTALKNKITPLNSTERLKMLAISRIFFQNTIKNIQASWVKQGFEETAESLDWGVNDIGGTLGDERITHCAGGNFGSGTSDEKLVNIIKSKNKSPILRDTLYLYQKNLTKI